MRSSSTTASSSATCPRPSRSSSSLLRSARPLLSAATAAASSPPSRSTRSSSAATAGASPHHRLPAALALHAQLLHRGLLFAPPPHAASALLHFYGAAGRLPSVRHLFYGMPFCDIASHNTMMMACTATVVGCSSGLDTARHLLDGMLHKNVLSMMKVFDWLEIRNLVCWNSMITGHCVYDEPGDGIQLFHEMRLDERRMVQMTDGRYDQMKLLSSVYYARVPA